MALYDPRTGRFRQQLGDPRYESIWTSLEEVDGCRESLAWSSFGQQCRKKKKDTPIMLFLRVILA